MRILLGIKDVTLYEVWLLRNLLLLTLMDHLNNRTESMDINVKWFAISMF